MSFHRTLLSRSGRSHASWVSALVTLVAVGTAFGVGLEPTMSSFVRTTIISPATVQSIPILHVLVILMENQAVGQVYGTLPFETKLAKSYAWGGNPKTSPGGTGYYALCHPSAPNYLGLTSGQTLQCGSDAYNTYSVQNIGHELQTAKIPWVAYEESAKTACQTSNSGNYAVRHNPFPYYSDLGGTSPGSACMSHVLPISNLTKSYPYTTTPPTFTFIEPNTLDDGHSSSALFGDIWLSKFVPKLMNQTWFATSVIFIVYDEATGTGSQTGYNGTKGGPVYMVAVSPYTRGVGALTTNCSQYNLLSTFEWLLAIPPTGTGHDGSSSFPSAQELFTFA